MILKRTWCLTWRILWLTWVVQLNTQISQGGVATYWRWSASICFCFSLSLPQNAEVIELLKSNHVCRSCHKNKSGLLFCGTLLTHSVLNTAIKQTLSRSVLSSACPAAGAPAADVTYSTRSSISPIGSVRWRPPAADEGLRPPAINTRFSSSSPSTSTSSSSSSLSGLASTRTADVSCWSRDELRRSADSSERHHQSVRLSVWQINRRTFIVALQK